MSTRQKSFFDHDNKPKARPPARPPLMSSINKLQRPQWNRTRSAGNTSNTGTNSNSTVAMATKPATKPSTQAKRKLKAFQFIEGRPESAPPELDANADKENAVVRQLKSKEDYKKAADAEDALPQVKAFPSTPATRLPLADLIGNIDSHYNQQLAQVESPDEQLVWAAGASPLPRPVPARISKKRAQSSSPVSSSQPDQNTARKETLDLQKLGLNTPQADPAAELWSRYATNARGSPSAKTPVFAHLINDASPHSSEAAGSVSGLRRWASCGTEWPASKAKRRKITGVFREQGKKGSDRESDIAAPELPKKSKTGLLIERIQETLAHSPSSSSPLPDTKIAQNAPSSPLQRLAPEAQISESHTIVGDPSEDLAQAPPKSSASSSSDFGDMDIDVDELERIEKIASARASPAIELPRSVELPQPPPAAEASPVEPIKSNPPVVANVDFDEDDFDDDVFDDDGEELFAADMEQLAAAYDVGPINPPQVVDSGPACSGSGVGLGIIEEDAEDEFGDDDIDEDQLAAAEIAATQAIPQGTTTKTPSKANDNRIQRYVIRNVQEGRYTDVRGRSLPEKVLLVEDERTRMNKAITLREAWVDTECTPNSYVHVIGEFSSTGQCFINNNSNMLVLHPDTLISAVVVSASFNCIRRAVLEDRIKATSEANEASMYGSLLHELFQEALKANRWDTEWLMAKVETILPRFFESIVELNLNVPRVLETVKGRLPEMQAWAQIFVTATPGPEAHVKGRNGKTIAMAVNKLLDVEEHVWSPMYGLKGNIDATVQVTMQDDGEEQTLTVPFEIKTGRSHQSHQAQTALYTLLISDRYDLDVIYGVLYYLNNSEISCVPAIRSDIIHIIMQRNKLASAIRERFRLPPMLDKAYQCGKCFAQKSCFVYNKLTENGTGDNLTDQEKFADLIKYLKPVDAEFFKKWDYLLTKEEGENMKFHKELWTLTSTEREKLGRCFANVIIEPGSFQELGDGAKISRFRYTFIRRETTDGLSFTESQVTVGEPIVISDEQGHYALAKGFVASVRKRRITVAVDRRLHNARTKRAGFDAKNNQVFTGIMEVSKDSPADEMQVEQEEEEPVLYRLDKDEFSNGMALVRNNLLQIMDETVFGAGRLRSLIVHGDPPKFKPTASAYTLFAGQLTMNPDQKQAVEKVMAAQDYALVLGMPGTGKTTTIAHIIRALVAKGKSVLLTSYQHSAVDNILLKLRQDKISILRLGAMAKVHPEVQEFAIMDAQPKATVEELRKSWEEPLVVATTCLGINHAIFGQRTFDYCIVDEASQITLPVCLGPIRMAKTFVLVGDHFQLPPLVQNEEAIAGGLNVSLFKMLSEQHQEAVISLVHQYRMCSDIMEISNRLIYSGRLVCGTDGVATRKMHVTKPDVWHNYHHPPSNSYPTYSPTKLTPPKACNCPGNPATCFLSRVLDPETKVIFLNTDLLFPHSQDTVSGPRITNNLEVTLVTQLTSLFLTAGVAPADLGIVTFYRSQLALLRQRMRVHPDALNVEMSTADRYQGRDKEAIIVSLVRSNTDGQVGDLLKDWRRVNVAVTRAQSKLVIIGSKRTMLAGGEVLTGLVRLSEEKGWMFDLSKDAIEGHVFDDGLATEGTGTPFKSSPVNFGSVRKSPTKKSPTKKRSVEKQPSQNPLSPLRKVSNVIDLLNPSPIKKRFKVPEKRGRIGPNVKKRSALGDILNDVL